MASEFIFNNTNMISYAGNTMPLTNMTSDVDVITQLCTNWNWYNIVLFAGVLICLLIKAYLVRVRNRSPEFREKFQSEYDFFDSMADYFMIVVCLFQLMLFISSLINGG